MERFIEHLEGGWRCPQFRLHRQDGRYVIIANLRKKFEVRQNYQGVVGVDINSGGFAITLDFAT